MSAALVVFGGLPGVGKTTIATQLAREMGAVWLRVDTIEQALAACGHIEIEGEGYAVAYALAASNLALGRMVIADCVNPEPLTREAWRAVAAQADAPLVEIEIVCSDIAEHRRRVETRLADIPGHTLPTWQEVVDRDYRPWDREVLVIDTAALSADEAVIRIWTRLRAA